MKLNTSIDDLRRAISLCVRCRMCTYGDWPENHSLCPIYNHHRVFTASAGGLIYLLRAISEKRIGYTLTMADLAYECTMCEQCDICQLVSLAPPYATASEIIRFIRYQLVKRGLIPDKKIQRIYQEVQQNNDYQGESVELKIPEEIKDENSDIVLFAECLHSKAQHEIYQAAIKLFQETRTHVTIFQTGGCCGSTLYDLGFWDELKKLLATKKNQMRWLNGKQVLFVNPHCQEFILRRLPDIAPEYPRVTGQHFSEFLLTMFRKGRIRANKRQHIKVTYHDPCHLGRGLGIYSPPREIISFLDGVEFVEMKRNQADAYCCGAGGGGRSQAFTEFSTQVAEDRLREFRETGADLLITACPYCKEMFQMNLPPEEKERVKDLVEFVDERTD